MPTGLKIVCNKKIIKKILWKEDYGKISELQKIVDQNIQIEDAFVGIFGKNLSGLQMLNSDRDVARFLSTQADDQIVTIEVVITDVSRNEALITKDYSPIYGTRPVGVSSSYVKTDLINRKSDFLKYKNLKIQNFIAFANQNYSPYHVIRKIEGNLIAEGYLRLKEDDKWDLLPGKKYYIKRGHYSSLVAFIIPPKTDSEKLYYKIIGSHCDSPCLRICPVSKIISGSYLQLDVQTYGGGLWRTWFDRDLAIGGRVTIQDKTDPSKLEVKLYTSKNALAYIPSLCPHLQNAIEETPLNPETHLRPIISLTDKCIDLNSGEDHFDFLIQDISDSLNVQKELIVDVDLCLADATSANIFGPKLEFISASKMDNTVSVWASLDAMIHVGQKPESLVANGIPMMAVFDHEEIGSVSTTGANSEFLPNLLKRITFTLSNEKSSSFEGHSRSLARSLLVSADMGHATHPNYPEYFKKNFMPTLNQGILIKTNDSLRYTTTSISRTILKTIAKNNGIPLQNYVARNDKHCGSTIGPFLSSLLGVESIDVGAGLIAMHSIRELIGVEDLLNYSELFACFFKASLPNVNDNF